MRCKLDLINNMDHLQNFGYRTLIIDQKTRLMKCLKVMPNKGQKQAETKRDCVMHPEITI